MGKRRISGTFMGWIAAAALAVYLAPAGPAAAGEIARPSNPGGPGAAATLTGDAGAGAKIFAANCMPCHGAEGKGGIPNPGSADGTVPALNPIDPTIANKDAKVFAHNADLFIQNGSTPEGPHPAIRMPAWGADKMLTQQQIADVIAYIIRLNTPR
jgi:mono/diheme cytochrome c family protein